MNLKKKSFSRVAIVVTIDYLFTVQRNRKRLPSHPETAISREILAVGPIPQPTQTSGGRQQAFLVDQPLSLTTLSGDQVKINYIKIVITELRINVLGIV